MSETLEAADVREVIKKWLVKEERSLRWLCRKCNFNYGTTYNCFVQKNFDVTDEKLSIINEKLGTNFTK